MLLCLVTKYKIRTAFLLTKKTTICRNRPETRKPKSFLCKPYCLAQYFNKLQEVSEVYL